MPEHAVLNATGYVAPNRLGSGTADGSKYLRDDGTWAAPTAAHPDLATHDTLGLATQAELDTHASAVDPHAGYVLESLVDAAGDLLVGSAPDALARLAKGADGSVLKMAAGAVGWGTDLTGAGSDPVEGLFAPGSFTLEDGKYSIMAKRLALTGAQVATLQGTSQLRIV